MFSIKESIKYGWEQFKANLEVSIFTSLFMLVLGYVSDDDVLPKHFLLTITIVILFIIARIGYTKIFLRIYDNEKPVFSDMFKEYGMFWRYIEVSILYPLAIVGGLILLIIPGIIWAVRFSLAPIILIDLNTGPIKAMRESYAITKGSFWKLLLFWLTLAVINIAGVMAFGVGLLITMPLSSLAAAYVYRELSKVKSGISTNTIQPPAALSSDTPTVA